MTDLDCDKSVQAWCDKTGIEITVRARFPDNPRPPTVAQIRRIGAAIRAGQRETMRRLKAAGFGK